MSFFNNYFFFFINENFFKIVDDNFLDEDIFLWLVGMFLLIVIFIFNENYNIPLLMKNTSKFNSEKEAHILLHYLNMMLFNHSTDKKNLLFLDCFIEHHKGSCLKAECPARKTFVKTKQLAKIFQSEIEDAARIQLLYLIESIYMSAIEKFLFTY